MNTSIRFMLAVSALVAGCEQAGTVVSPLSPHLNIVSHGEILWARQFGTPQNEAAFTGSADGVALYVAGRTAGSLVGVSAGSFDAWIRRYDFEGNAVWTHQFGTAALDEVLGIHASEYGIYVAGTTAGTLPGQVSSGGNDAFVRKYDEDGNVLWTVQFGSGGTERGQAVHADASGVYVAGSTSAAFSGYENSGGRDAFVRKFDHNGQVVWTRQFGSTGDDLGSALTSDRSGLYLAGFATGALPGLTALGDLDIYLRKYDSAGNEIWTQQFGSPDRDAPAFQLVAEPSGIYLMGETGGSLGGPNAGGNDIFIRKYRTDGTSVWTRQFGSAADDFIEGMATEATGIYGAGVTLGSMPGFTTAGAADLFAVKYDRDGNQVWLRQFGTEANDGAFSTAAGGKAAYAIGYTRAAFPGFVNIGGNDMLVIALRR